MTARKGTIGTAAAGRCGQSTTLTRLCKRKEPCQRRPAPHKQLEDCLCDGSHAALSPGRGRTIATAAALSLKKLAVKLTAGRFDFLEAPAPPLPPGVCNRSNLSAKIGV